MLPCWGRSCLGIAVCHRYKEPTIALSCGSMLRDCLRHSPLARWCSTTTLSWTDPFDASSIQKREERYWNRGCGVVLTFFQYGTPFLWHGSLLELKTEDLVVCLRLLTTCIVLGCSIGVYCSAIGSLSFLSKLRSANLKLHPMRFQHSGWVPAVCCWRCT